MPDMHAANADQVNPLRDGAGQHLVHDRLPVASSRRMPAIR
jgi:hypothetical protein